MLRKFRFTKKIIMIIILSVAISLLFSQIFLTKHDIETSNTSIIYDKNRNLAIQVSSGTTTFKKIPRIALDYIEKDNQYKNIDKIVYPDNVFKQSIAKLLTKSLYNEHELKELYLNQLYFQNGIIGIHSAANYYFNKKIEELTKMETIYLLSKTVNLSENNEMNLTLFIRDLYKNKMISKVDENTFIYRIPSLIESLYNEKTYNQSYIDFVIHEVESNLKMKEEVFFRKGLKIYSNLDPKIIYTLYSEVQKTKMGMSPVTTDPIETGIAIIDFRTGKIVALLGGRKYQHSNLNRAFQITRQPASAFKPLIVFAPAIDLGWKPSDKLKDVPLRFGSFKPKNYDYIYRGEVTLKEALIHSYNVPAAWLLNKIGLDKGISYVKKTGLFHINKKDGLGLALGFTSVGTSPLALAQAYSIFPNDGELVNAHAVYMVKGSFGRTIYKVKQEENKIIDKKSARIMNDLLHDVVNKGTGEKAKVKGQSIAGKTGTTSYDAWFVGYNKQYVGAIWMGPDEVTPENRMDFGGGDAPAPLFKNIFSNFD